MSYTPLSDMKEARDKLNSEWEARKSILLKSMECDETPLKCENSTEIQYHYSKKHGFIVKFDNKIRQRVGMTQEEERDIRKRNNID